MRHWCHWSVVAALALSLACASADLTITRPLATPVRDVSLGVQPSPEMGDEDQSRFRTLLTSTLADRGVTVRSSTSGVPSLSGEIETFQPGNRALRYIIGFGAGRGRFASTWVVSDPTGATVGECRVDGGIVMGVFGGSFDDVQEKVGERLAEFLTGTE
jgi:hypothetical protein